MNKSDVAGDEPLHTSFAFEWKERNGIIMTLSNIVTILIRL